MSDPLPKLTDDQAASTMGHLQSEMEPVRTKCSKCGGDLPPSRLNHAAISKALGADPVCQNCIPARFKGAMDASRQARERRREEESEI